MQRSNLILDVVSQVIREFDLQLDELHNDSTTVTLTGDYADAKQEKQLDELLRPAITWGHKRLPARLEATALHLDRHGGWRCADLLSRRQRQRHG